MRHRQLQRLTPEESGVLRVIAAARPAIGYVVRVRPLCGMDARRSALSPAGWSVTCRSDACRSPALVHVVCQRARGLRPRTTAATAPRTDSYSAKGDPQLMEHNCELLCAMPSALYRNRRGIGGRRCLHLYDQWPVRQKGRVNRVPAGIRLREIRAPRNRVPASHHPPTYRSGTVRAD